MTNPGTNTTYQYITNRALSFRDRRLAILLHDAERFKQVKIILIGDFYIQLRAF